MVKKKNPSESVEQKISATFAELLIERMEQIQADWKQPWIQVGGSGLPRNMDGKQYNGMNTLMLMLHAQEKGYQMPYWMTYNRAAEEGAEVKKGEKGFPVCFWNFTFRDKDGNRISEEDYKNLSEQEKNECKKIPYLRTYVVFNIQQTRYPEVKPDEYAKLKEGLHRPLIKDDEGRYRNMELDHMIKNGTWVCPIELKESNDAYYSISKDSIVLPLKEQFYEGEEFYGTLLHEMAHSTGAEGRLNRQFGGKFGSEEYAREELVAEMTSAVVCQQVGIDKGIKDQSVAYLQSWLKNLKENPKFILTLMGEINKSVNFIQERVFTKEMAEDVKAEAMQDINEFIEKKNEEQKEIKPVTMTADEIKQKNVSIGSYRTDDFLKKFEEQNKAPQLKDTPAYMAWQDAKTQYPGNIILVMDKGTFYTFEDDAQKVGAHFNKDGQPKVDAATGELKFSSDLLDTVLPGLVRGDDKIRITNTVNVQNKLKADVAQQTNPDTKKLHMGYLGDGIALWEEGDDEYTAHISEDRRITVNEGKYFDEENNRKILELKEKGNMVVGKNDYRYLVLNPVKAATGLYYNEKNAQSVPVSFEEVKGKFLPVVSLSRQVLPTEGDEYAYGTLQYPRDMVFSVVGVDNIRTRLQQAHQVGVDVKMALESWFQELLGQLEDELDPLERKNYKLYFSVKDGALAAVGKDRSQLAGTEGLPQFYFAGNHLKFNTPGQGAELSVAQQMLTGDRIIKITGVENMVRADGQLADMGISFKSDSFRDGQFKGFEAMYEMAPEEECAKAELYYMVHDGIITDAEPAIHEKDYKEIPMYTLDASGIKPYEVKENITNQKNKVMEEKNNVAPQEQQEAADKKQRKDGIQVYQTTTSKRWVVQAWKDGVGTPARAISQDDLKEYFDSVKGKTGKEVQDARQKLYDKYLSPEAEKARAERVAAREQNQGQGEKKGFTPPIKLPEVAEDVKARIEKASVYTMSDGTSHAVRAVIDGNQQQGKRIPDGLAISFLKGYKDLTPEQRNERAVAVAAYAYKSVLEAPKQEQSQSQGMGR